MSHSEEDTRCETTSDATSCGNGAAATSGDGDDVIGQREQVCSGDADGFDLLDGEEESGESAGDQNPAMYSMMVGGLLELDQALQESSKLLQAKEKELVECREERNRLKEIMAKEILRKTELSSILEDSRHHVVALEALIEKWQEEVRHVKQKEESTRAQLTEHVEQLQLAREEAADAQAVCAATAEENTTLKKRVSELKKALPDDGKQLRRGSSTGPDHTEQELNWAFLKTSVFHYFTGMYPYEQAKAIVSILNFDPQERKSIYAKLDEKYGRSGSSASQRR